MMKQSITPANNPNLWYNWYEIIKEDAPELCDQFIENTAAKMELTVDYFMEEFLWTLMRKNWSIYVMF